VVDNVGVALVQPTKQVEDESGLKHGLADVAQLVVLTQRQYSSMEESP
jgi:hypothetical protein